jgi:hypothetical protein
MDFDNSTNKFCKDFVIAVGLYPSDPKTEFLFALCGIADKHAELAACGSRDPYTRCNA